MCNGYVDMLDERYMRRTISPALHGTVTRTVKSFPVRTIPFSIYTGASSTVQLVNWESTFALNCLRLVLTAQWARLNLCTLHVYQSVFQTAQSTAQSIINTEFTNTVLQRSKRLLLETVFKAIRENTYSSEYVQQDNLMYFLSSQLQTLAACSIERWRV